MYVSDRDISTTFCFSLQTMKNQNIKDSINFVDGSLHFIEEGRCQFIHKALKYKLLFIFCLKQPI